MHSSEGFWEKQTTLSAGPPMSARRALHGKPESSAESQ